MFNENGRGSLSHSFPFHTSAFVREENENETICNYNSHLVIISIRFLNSLQISVEGKKDGWKLG